MPNLNWETAQKSIEVNHPSDIAFEILNEKQSGYCVIICKDNYKTADTVLVESAVWLPSVPYNPIINYLIKLSKDKLDRCTIYKYVEGNTYHVCRNGICVKELEGIQDTTLTVKMAIEHERTIQSLLS